MNKLTMLMMIGLSSVANAKSIDGYKDLKFGTSKQVLESNGWTCDRDNMCVNYNYVGNTVFDGPVERTYVFLDRQDKLRTVSLQLNIDSCLNALNKMTDTFNAKNAEINRTRTITFMTWKFGTSSITHVTDMGRLFICTVSYNTENYAKVPPVKSTDF